MLSIDRFEGEFALCEDETGKLHPILREKIPQNAKEGDLLVPAGDCYQIEETQTRLRRRQSASRYEKLFGLYRRENP